MSVLQIQSQAIPPKIVQPLENIFSSDRLQEAVDTVDQAGFKSTIGLDSEFIVQQLGGNVNPSNVSTARVIDVFNAEIARSVLAMFILLDGSGGAFALAQNQSDFFVKSLQADIGNLETQITEKVIAPLYHYNFADPQVARFSFRSLIDEHAASLNALLIQFAQYGELARDFKEIIIRAAAANMGLDVDAIKELTQERESISFGGGSDKDDDEDDDEDEEEEGDDSEENQMPGSTVFNQQITDAMYDSAVSLFSKKAKVIWSGIKDEVVDTVSKMISSMPLDQVTLRVNPAIFPRAKVNYLKKTLAKDYLKMHRKGRQMGNKQTKANVKAPADLEKRINTTASRIVDVQIFNLTDKLKEMVDEAKAKSESRRG